MFFVKSFTMKSQNHPTNEKFVKKHNLNICVNTKVQLDSTVFVRMISQTFFWLNTWKFINLTKVERLWERKWTLLMRKIVEFSVHERFWKERKKKPFKSTITTLINFKTQKVHGATRISFKVHQQWNWQKLAWSFRITFALLQVKH